ncbi:MAG: YbaN family protein [Thiotrichales bacterium]|nr:YbaN family protein [Thiotrichales bacterium]
MISNIKKVTLVAIAVISTITGLIGIFVPLLPTTCFIILAAWCLAKSDPRYLRWVYEQPRLACVFRKISPRFMPREVHPGR